MSKLIIEKQTTAFIYTLILDYCDDVPFASISASLPRPVGDHHPKSMICKALAVAFRRVVETEHFQLEFGKGGNTLVSSLNTNELVEDTV